MTSNFKFLIGKVSVLLLLLLILFGCHSVNPSESPMIGQSAVVTPSGESGVDFINRGDQLLQSGRYDQAVAAYNEAIEGGHELARAYAGRGHANMSLRQFKQALEDFSMSLEYERNPVVLASRCNAYRLLDDLSSALQDCREAIELAPENMDVRIAFAMLLLDKGDIDEARSEANAAHEINPNSAKPYYILAQIYSIEGNYEEAIKSLSECIEIDPDEPIYYWERGFLYYSLGKVEESKKDMRAVLEYGETYKDGELMFEAGNLLRSLGEEP